MLRRSHRSVKKYLIIWLKYRLSISARTAVLVSVVKVVSYLYKYEVRCQIAIVAPCLLVFERWNFKHVHNKCNDRCVLGQVSTGHPSLHTACIWDFDENLYANVCLDDHPHKNKIIHVKNLTNSVLVIEFIHFRVLTW